MSTYNLPDANTLSLLPHTAGTGQSGNSYTVTTSHPADRLIVELERKKLGLIAYCQLKLDDGDWHAVQDAASDIRELAAKLELLKFER